MEKLGSPLSCEMMDFRGKCLNSEGNYPFMYTKSSSSRTLNITILKIISSYVNLKGLKWF